jgi:hypothetical protein
MVTARVFFLHLFGIEAAVKLLALHPRRHFAARGAGLDAAVTLGAYLLVVPHLYQPPSAAVVSWAFLPHDPAFVRVLRLVNLLRLFKLVPAVPSHVPPRHVPVVPCLHHSTLPPPLYPASTTLPCLHHSPSRMPCLHLSRQS